MRRIRPHPTRRAAGCAVLVLLTALTLPTLASAERRRHQTYRHYGAEPYQPSRLPGTSPAFGGYTYNGYGYGRFTSGADGGYGGYPPGSAGAIILRQQQDRKCHAVPEAC